MAILFKFILNALPWVLRVGTLLGKDPVFKYRAKETVGSWVLTELNGADRQVFADLTNRIMDMEEPDRTRQIIQMKQQVIAAAARNKRGYFVLDPLKREHLAKVALHPDSVLDKALEVIAEQSGMPWLVPPKDITGEASQSVAESADASSDIVDWEGNGGHPEIKDVSAVNPSPANRLEDLPID